MRAAIFAEVLPRRLEFHVLVRGAKIAEDRLARLKRKCVGGGYQMQRLKTPEWEE
jgi:hypothetical protein